MAFKKTLSQRIFTISRISTAALTNCRISSPCTAAQSKILNIPSAKPAPDPGDDGIFRRYLHRHSAAVPPPELRFLPTGEKLIEKLREMDIARNRARLDGCLMPPEESPAAEEEAPEEGLTVRDAAKILRVSQLEAVKARLRGIERDCVSYSEFLEICSEGCYGADQAVEFARMLDQSGSVIVLGKVVFLKPEQVVKAIQGLIPLPTSQHSPIDGPAMKELQELEKQKAAIDSEARYLVRRELWGGLGYLVVQTAVFMRLTFWELSWDVMEPICFYVTSLYFMFGYTFFLRTSREPSFEGFFQSRFSAKQKRLIKARNFDIERYNELKKAYSMREDAVTFSTTSPVV